MFPLASTVSCVGLSSSPVLAAWPSPKHPWTPAMPTTVLIVYCCAQVTPHASRTAEIIWKLFINLRFRRAFGRLETCGGRNRLSLLLLPAAASDGPLAWAVAGTRVTTRIGCGPPAQAGGIGT